MACQLCELDGRWWRMSEIMQRQSHTRPAHTEFCCESLLQFENICQTTVQLLIQLPDITKHLPKAFCRSLRVRSVFSVVDIPSPRQLRSPDTDCRINGMSCQGMRYNITSGRGTFAGFWTCLLLIPGFFPNGSPLLAEIMARSSGFALANYPRLLHYPPYRV